MQHFTVFTNSICLQLPFSHCFLFLFIYLLFVFVVIILRNHLAAFFSLAHTFFFYFFFNVVFVWCCALFVFSCAQHTHFYKLSIEKLLFLFTTFFVALIRSRLFFFFAFRISLRNWCIFVYMYYMYTEYRFLIKNIFIFFCFP